MKTYTHLLNIWELEIWGQKKEKWKVDNKNVCAIIDIKNIK